MLHAQSLSKLSGIRHGFFTRVGGVSDGLYESLNGGVGSEDAPAKVAENRARMAASLGVAPERFLTCYQIHSPTVVVAETPWPASDRPRADAIVTRTPGLAIGVSTADCGPVLLADRGGARDRRRACRLARRADRRHRGDGRRHGEARRRAETNRGRGRTDDPPAELRGRPGPDRPLRRARTQHHPLLQAGRSAPVTAMFDLAGYVVSRLRRAEVAEIEDLGHCTYADPAQFYSYRRSTHRAEADYGRHINAIALAD